MRKGDTEPRFHIHLLHGKGKVGRKGRQETDLQDLEGHIEILPGHELQRESVGILQVEDGQDILRVEDEEESEKETEEKSNRDFTVPEGMHALPRPSKLNKEVVGLLITKHFGDFGWGQGKIKSYNSKRKFPFEIKWSDELRPRFHQLTIDEYVETERKEGSKAGDFTIFTKDS